MQKFFAPKFNFINIGKTFNKIWWSIAEGLLNLAKSFEDVFYELMVNLPTDIMDYLTNGNENFNNMYLNMIWISGIVLAIVILSKIFATLYHQKMDGKISSEIRMLIVGLIMIPLIPLIIPEILGLIGEVYMFFSPDKDLTITSSIYEFAGGRGAEFTYNSGINPVFGIVATAAYIVLLLLASLQIMSRLTIILLLMILYPPVAIGSARGNGKIMIEWYSLMKSKLIEGPVIMISFSVFVLITGGAAVVVSNQAVLLVVVIGCAIAQLKVPSIVAQLTGGKVAGMAEGARTGATMKAVAGIASGGAAALVMGGAAAKAGRTLASGSSSSGGSAQTNESAGSSPEPIKRGSGGSGKSSILRTQSGRRRASIVGAGATIFGGAAKAAKAAKIRSNGIKALGGKEEYRKFKNDEKGIFKENKVEQKKQAKKDKYGSIENFKKRNAAIKGEKKDDNTKEIEKF